MSFFIVMLGPPGAGKGTQAAIIAEKCGIPHISSGNLFRDNMHNDTPLGRKAKEFMERGDLVPDEVTIAMVEDRLSQPDCTNGALLDGYPRTPFQAQALDDLLTEMGKKIDIVPLIQVEAEELVNRLSGRWVCRAEGHVYHMTHNPPKKDKVCDLDGSQLYQRDDDNRETVERRIKVYEQQTRPLIEYYEKKGLLVKIDGKDPIEKVTNNILRELDF